MLKIYEVLFRTMFNDGYEYDNRYIFKGEIQDLEKYGFRKLSTGDVVKELKTKVTDDNIVYYKKSGLGYFVVFMEPRSDYIVFMSGVPIWWIDDEEKTNYYDDLELMIKEGLVEKVEVEK